MNCRSLSAAGQACGEGARTREELHERVLDREAALVTTETFQNMRDSRAAVFGGHARQQHTDDHGADQGL